MALHAAGQIETQGSERGSTQRLLIERQRLLNDGRLGRSNHGEGAAGVHIGQRVGADRRGAPQLDPPPGRRDARLRLALEQEGLKVREKALDLPAASPIDKAERRIADRYPIFRVDGVKRFYSAGGQLVVGLLDDGLVVPHRLVMRAGPLSVAVKIGEPAA